MYISLHSNASDLHVNKKRDESPTKTCAFYINNYLRNISFTKDRECWLVMRVLDAAAYISDE